SGQQLGNFDVLYDPLSREQIFVGKLAYRDNRTYFDTWTSFTARSSRSNTATPPARFKLDNFRIEANIDEERKMTCVTRMSVTPNQEPASAVPLGISRKMHVTEARIDGRPVEVFSRESMRSNLIAANDNEDFLLVPDAPLAAGTAHEVEVHHAGEVI